MGNSVIAPFLWSTRTAPLNNLHQLKGRKIAFGSQTSTQGHWIPRIMFEEVGRNTYRYYTKTMTEQALEQSFVQSSLRDALEKSEFLLVYQPQVELKSGRLVGLEVTEGFVMRAPEDAVQTLNALRDMGIELAIDDFGTGYSSLSYLKQLPINKLKIDQSFIRGIPSDVNDLAISEAVIAMGRALDLRVIAEGIESKAQADFLIDKGCQEGQGYLFSKPIPPSELEAWLDGTLIAKLD